MNHTSDPFLQMELALFLSLFFFVLIVICVFFLLRLRRKLFRRGYSPSFASLGNALQELHAIGISRVEHVIHEQKKAEADENEEAHQDVKFGATKVPPAVSSPQWT